MFCLCSTFGRASTNRRRGTSRAAPIASKWQASCHRLCVFCSLIEYPFVFSLLRLLAVQVCGEIDRFGTFVLIDIEEVNALRRLALFVLHLATEYCLVCVVLFVHSFTNNPVDTLVCRRWRLALSRRLHSAASYIIVSRCFASFVASCHNTDDRRNRSSQSSSHAALLANVAAPNVNKSLSSLCPT